MRGLLGVRAEHGADGDCGHGVFLSVPRSKRARVQLVPNVTNPR
jgi:hypothetical protein